MTATQNLDSIERRAQGVDSRRIQAFRTSLSNWYRWHGREFSWRRHNRTNYELVIAEMLLQRTRAEMVASFYSDFLGVFPSWPKLAAARESELRRILKPIGLWRRRAASLLALAKEMVTRRGRFPKAREEIEELPGVGQYIANAILLLVHDKPEPLLDVNMARVLERCFGPRKLVDIRHDSYLQDLSRRIVAGRTPRLVNWGILDLAALVCLPRQPRCSVCPLRRICRYYSVQERN